MGGVDELERVERQIKRSQVAVLCVIIVAAGAMYVDDDSELWEHAAAEAIAVIVALGRLRQSLVAILRKRYIDNNGGG